MRNQAVQPLLHILPILFARLSALRRYGPFMLGNGRAKGPLSYIPVFRLQAVNEPVPAHAKFAHRIIQPFPCYLARSCFPLIYRRRVMSKILAISVWVIPSNNDKNLWLIPIVSNCGWVESGMTGSFVLSLGSKPSNSQSQLTAWLSDKYLSLSHGALPEVAHPLPWVVSL